MRYYDYKMVSSYQSVCVIIAWRKIVMATKPEVTLTDLYRVVENGKAEIVNGEIILMSPIGAWSSGNITDQLIEEYLEHHRHPSNQDSNNFMVE